MNVTTAPLVLLLQIVTLLALASWLLWLRRRQPGREIRLPRPIRQLSQVVDAAREEDRLLLLPLGRGSIAGAQSADSIAALALTGQSDRPGRLPTHSMLSGEGTLWLAASQQNPAACFVGPDAATYAAGIREALADSPTATIAPCGLFGDEYLLFAEPGAWRSLDRPAAAASPALLPFLLTTSAEPVLGAELYEAAALFQESPARRRPLLGWLSIVLAFIALCAAILQSLLPS